MKKFMGSSIVLAILPIFIAAGCNGPSPSNPNGFSVLSGNSAPQVAQTPVNLNSDSTFAVLANTTITNSGPTTLCGNLGLSPGTTVSGSPVLSCGVLHVNDSTAAQAQLDLTTAYNDAAGRTTPDLVSGDLGGLTLHPGLYRATGPLQISTASLSLDAQGNANGVFIFQVASTLTVSPGIQVTLTGGTQAANVFWQVGTSCALGSNVQFKGVILAQDGIVFGTGAALEGRAFSQTSQVTFSTNIITNP